MNIICWLHEYTSLELATHQAHCPYCQGRYAANQRALALFEGVEAPTSTRTYNDLLLLLPRTSPRTIAWQLPALGFALAGGVGAVLYLARPADTKPHHKVA